MAAMLFVALRVVPATGAWAEEARSSARDVALEAAMGDAQHGILVAAAESLARREERLGVHLAGLIPGDSPAAASAWIADYVAGAARSTGVRIGATRMQQDTSSAAIFTRVELRIEATGDVRGISRFLAEVESAPTRLGVILLSIAQSDPAASHERMEVLRAELVIEGLALTRGTRWRDRSTSRALSRAGSP